MTSNHLHLTLLAGGVLLLALGYFTPVTTLTGWMTLLVVGGMMAALTIWFARQPDTTMSERIQKALRRPR